MKRYIRFFQNPHRAVLIKDKVILKSNEDEMLIIEKNDASADIPEFELLKDGKSKEHIHNLPYKSDCILRISSPFFRCKNTNVKYDDKTGELSFAEQLQVSTKNRAIVYDEDQIEFIKDPKKGYFDEYLGIQQLSDPEKYVDIGIGLSTMSLENFTES